MRGANLQMTSKAERDQIIQPFSLASNFEFELGRKPSGLAALPISELRINCKHFLLWNIIDFGGALGLQIFGLAIGSWYLPS